MPSVSALDKYPCAACGAQAEWNPGKQALICSFCGTTTPFTIDEGGTIHELDLAAALRELPDEQRGWLAEKRSVQCQSCKAVSKPPGHATHRRRRPYCRVMSTNQIRSRRRRRAIRIRPMS